MKHWLKESREVLHDAAIEIAAVCMVQAIDGSEV
jgi:hypothetical protein